MYVIDQTHPVAAQIPGVAHSTWAGQQEGLTQISLWRQTLAPESATPPHSHDCDEVVLCQSGEGELHIDGRIHRFGAHQTLVLPRGRQHQILNIGSTPMQILGIFGATPVPTFGPDGSIMQLPWRT